MRRARAAVVVVALLSACAGCCGAGGSRQPRRPDWMEPESAEREARAVFEAYCRALRGGDVDGMFQLLSTERRNEFLAEFGSYERFAAEARERWLPLYEPLANGATVIRCVPPSLLDPVVDLYVVMGNGDQQKFRLVREGGDWRVSQGWQDIRETVR